METPGRRIGCGLAMALSEWLLAYIQLTCRTSSISAASRLSTVLQRALTGSPAFAASRSSGVIFLTAVFNALSGGRLSMRASSLRHDRPEPGLKNLTKSSP